jgi:hypothetical protein
MKEMAILDISRAGASADADKTKWMVSRGMLREGKPYEVIGDTGDIYIDRFLIIEDELGQATTVHESMLVPYGIWLAEKRDKKLIDIGI